jgi:hypothetical protein
MATRQRTARKAAERPERRDGKANGPAKLADPLRDDPDQVLVLGVR